MQETSEGEIWDHNKSMREMIVAQFIKQLRFIETLEIRMAPTAFRSGIESLSGTNELNKIDLLSIVWRQSSVVLTYIAHAILKDRRLSDFRDRIGY